MFIQDSRRSYRTYTYSTEHILVLQILYGAYSRISDTKVPVGTIEHFAYLTDTRVLVGTTDTRVPVGTTGLIRIQDLSDTGVPVGTTKQFRYGQNLIKCRSTRRYY